MRRIIFALWAILIVNLAFGGNEHYSVRHHAATLEKDLIVKYEDPFRVAQISTVNNIGSDAYVQVGFDTYFPEFFDGYHKYEFELQVKKYDYNWNTSTPYETTTETLIIDTDHQNGGVYTNIARYNFSGAYKVEVTIKKMYDRTDSPGFEIETGEGMPGGVYLEVGALVERYHPFSPGEPESTDLSAVVIDHISDGETMADEVEVRWIYEIGAEVYELEYMFIQPVDKTGSLYTAASVNFSEEEFANGATRVRLKAQKYKIPVLYDKSYLVYRLKPIGRGGAGYAYNVPGPWSSEAPISSCTSGKLDCFHNVKLEVPSSPASSFLQPKNWQVTSSFAEDGKRKDVVTYVDGALRGRQVVTRNNSDNRSIVGETVYDYYGRPAVNILPAPVVNPLGGTASSTSTLRYFEAFNQNTSSAPYSYQDFDLLSGGNCSVAPNALDSSSGASLYYSSNNGEQDRIHSYLPRANGYPMVQTEYMEDNTGRMRKTSGVGSPMQIGSGHEVQMSYVSVVQSELDRLFASDAGYSSFYTKQITVSPNDQATVAYIDSKGQTVATAYLGSVTGPYENFEIDEQSLDSESKISDITVDLLNKNSSSDPDDLQDDNQLNNSGDELIYNGFVYNAVVNDDLQLDYTVDVPGFVYDCFTEATYQPVFDLELFIEDNCGSQTSFSGGPEVQIGSSSYSSSSNTTSSKSFSLTGADLGDYNIYKSLKINEEVMESYLNHFLSNATSPCLLDLSDFMGSVEYSACDISCLECENSIPSGLSQSVKDELIALCWEPCTYTSKCDNIFQSLLGDVTPYGQYAAINGQDTVISVFAHTSLLPEAQSQGLTSAPWRNPEKYNDPTKLRYYEEDLTTPSTIRVIDGIPENVSNTRHGSIYPEELLYVSDFIDYWKPSWSYSLVKYHPEFCSKSLCDDIKSNTTTVSGKAITAEDFEFMITSASSYDDASAAPVYQGTGTVNLVSTSTPIYNYDPFFQNANLGSGYVTDLANDFSNYAVMDGTTYTIWEMTTYLVECGNWFGDNIASCVSNASAMGSGTTAIKDRQWETFKGLYLGLREKYMAKFFDGKVSDCYNGCIGQADFKINHNSIPNIVPSGSSYSD
ncbi:MAG: hypothetical protein ACPF9D_06645, partial [Owenweeksia sp.]